jgi:DNA-binding CsgD family transcriptional regulator
LPAGIVEPGWIPWRSDLGLALRRASADDEEPRALVEEELRLAREVGSDRATGIALRALGLLIGGDHGIEYLREATALLANTTSRLEHARAEIDLGAALRRRRERRLARIPSSEALDSTLTLGAGALAARAREELTATGARPRTPYRRGIHSLTVSERRIARLAAAGRTNREIAEELYVTIKTVEAHLRSVYGKLEIEGRRQLAASLSGRPATPDESRSRMPLGR